LPDWLGLLISSIAISLYSMEAEVDVGGKAWCQELTDSTARESTADRQHGEPTVWSQS
jgi:hypothetical protein